MHEDEEIRFLLSGSGFFDVRGEAPWTASRVHLPRIFMAEHSTEAWIRIHMMTGDLLILPAGIYHRFTLDENNAVKTMRLFKVGARIMS